MKRSARCAAGACAVGLFAMATAALACGVCIDDKVAVTYDHAVVQRATARSHVVVFAEIAARGTAEQAARAVSIAASRVPGVDAGSVRVAAAPAAVSFALDPGVGTPAAALRAIESSTGAPGVRLTMLRVIH